MAPEGGRFRAVLQNFQRCLSKDDLEVFSCTTLRDVHTTITSIQNRQETERTLMDMTRLRVSLKRMKDLTTTICAFDKETDYQRFMWGPLRATLHSTSQDQKALDILLDAYDKVGHRIPVLRHLEPVFASHPGLCTVLELIYQNALPFQERVLYLFTHPDMRILFRPMWNDYTKRFNATLETLDKLQVLTKQMERISEMPDIADCTRHEKTHETRIKSL